MIKGKISPDILLKIKSTVNLVEVVGEHVVLRKSGSNYTGLCPFHSERSPSFNVSESKQLYHCYGCKKGGDVFSFVMEILGVSFPEAIEDLAEKARLQLPQNWAGSSGQDPEEEKNRSAYRLKQAQAYKLNRFAAAYFHHHLQRHPVAQSYLQKRGISDELVKSYYLGSSSDSWDGLAQHLVTQKAPIDLAVELGLIRPSIKTPTRGGSGYFDLFRNRVLFPILNLRGKVAGFGGRELGGQTPKYLNSSDSFIFQKSKLAFGLYQAQKYIREKDEIILVEGYFDVLALQMAGIRNVVATCGTSLTVEHLTLFKRFANRVTVLFDGDRAGISATERAMELGLEQGMILYGAELPPGLDPDEMVIHPETGLLRPEGKEKMIGILSSAKPIFDARIDDAIQTAHEGPESRAQALKRLGSWLARYQDAVGREVRIQYIQKELDVSRHLIQEAMGMKQALGKMQNTSLPVPKKLEKRNEPKMNQARVGQPIGQIDRTLLAGIALGGEFSAVFAKAKDNLPLSKGLSDLFYHPKVRAFMTSVVSTPDFMERLKSVLNSEVSEDIDPQIRAIVSETLVSDASVSLEEFRGALLKAQARNWAQFSQHIKTAIADAELKKDADLQVRLMKDYLDVQRKMKEFSSFYDEE